VRGQESNSCRTACEGEVLRAVERGPTRSVSGDWREGRDKQGEGGGVQTDAPSLGLDQPSVQVGLSDSPFVLPSVPKLPVQVNSVWFPWVIVKL
jgi:hypothetical protein